MKILLFSVYDSAAKAFLEPFHSQTVETAIRAFREVVNREGHSFNKFPEDYSLFAVGEFDQAKGLLDAYEVPRSVGLAIMMIESGEIDA